jgi:hypothetical protein
MPDDDAYTTALEKHADHDTVYAVAGAPGRGASLYCNTCKKYIWSNIRILEPWEVE